MNRLERIAIAAGLLIFVVSLQFGACIAGTVTAILAAIVIGAVATHLWINFDLPGGHTWRLPLLFSIAELVAIGIVELMLKRAPFLWLCIPLAAASSAATEFFLLWNSARCGLCNRRLRTQSVVFRCPRCSLSVCDQTCWSFEHRRCRLCLEQRVPVLPIQERWWTRATGPRAEYGRCQVCLASAEQVDLRLCPHCRRLECRDCWDFGNGECARCGQALPHLPESLTMAVAQIPEEISAR